MNLPQAIFMSFTQRHVNDCYLRNLEGKLWLLKPNTYYLKRCFSYSGACLWNNLPQDLKKRWFYYAAYTGYCNKVTEISDSPRQSLKAVVMSFRF